MAITRDLRATYKEVNGTKIEVDVFLPRSSSAKAYPVG